MRTVLRNALAGAIIAAIPVTSTIAAVRPNAAVPTAASTAVSAQVYSDYDRDDDGIAAGWPVLLFGAAMGVLVVILMLEDDDDDRSLTRG